MSAGRALAFGDLDAGIWGAAWVPPLAGAVPVAVGAGSGTEVREATLHGAGHEERWRLEGEGIEVVLSPSTRAVTPEERTDGIGGFDQLCRASGRVAITGAERKVECLGWRSAHDGALELDRIESFRQVSAWFDPEDGLALFAVRPRGARGQEADVVVASVFEPERARRVADPRLSTTYTAGGRPARAGLELWVDDEEAEDPDTDNGPGQFPRRAAAETLAEGAGWQIGGFAVHGAPLRWHSRGRDGAGVYLLGRRQ
jgi:hypothetical protein